jgi:hypothetical protein
MHNNKHLRFECDALSHLQQAAADAGIGGRGKQPADGREGCLVLRHVTLRRRLSDAAHGVMAFIINMIITIIITIITWNGMLGSSACSSTSRGTTLAGAPAIISRQEAARALSR